ncbi:MAG TPA: M15 family metallopeptidase [Candidatus Binatia bacterium]|nr:M15 family metallopeptidase [Candidatus Binatia bacterium]
MARRTEYLAPTSWATIPAARHCGWVVAALLAAVLAMAGSSIGTSGTPSSGAAPRTAIAAPAVHDADATVDPSPAATAVLPAPSPLAAPPLSNDRLDEVPTVGAVDPPACTFGEELATDATPGDWRRTLLDTDRRLPAGYAPPDLVPTSRAGIGGGSRIRAIVIPDLRAMAADAAAHGHPLVVVSAYRSFHDQQVTFATWVDTSGLAAALASSARPGHSEHQLGVAIDFGERGGRAPWEYGDWAARPTGAWLAANAWRYGFVMSYPRGATAVTCYAYEPWHYRYVGRAEAAAIHASGDPLREYLWQVG